MLLARQIDLKSQRCDKEQISDKGGARREIHAVYIIYLPLSFYKRRAVRRNSMIPVDCEKIEGKCSSLSLSLSSFQFYSLGFKNFNFTDAQY